MARYSAPTPGSGIIGAAIIGGSILAGSFLLNNSLHDTSEQLQAIQASLTETRDQLKDLASNRPAAAAAPARRGPDPNKVYAINTKGAPVKGSPNAKVELVEFSDFQ